MVAGALDLDKGTQPPNPASGDGRLWIDGDGNVYVLEDDGTNTAVGGGGSMSSFTLAADTGTAETVADGNTVTIAGGTGIDTSVAATDTVTVAIDSTVTTNDGTQTLTNKTLTTPTIADLSNATHDHEDAAGGGTLALAAITDAGTIAAQDADSVDIDGGAIDGATIGGTTPAAVTGTTVDSTGDMTAGNGHLVTQSAPNGNAVVWMIDGDRGATGADGVLFLNNITAAVWQVAKVANGVFSAGMMNVTYAGVVQLPTSTTTPATVAGVPQLWNASGALTVRDGSGNVTTLSPHPQDTLVDTSGRVTTHVYKELNTFTGRRVELDIVGALMDLEASTGNTYIHEDRAPLAARENKLLSKYKQKRRAWRERKVS